ncbi:MAG: cyclic GMP-AMP synthase DncV-like nucleotidyltransferase [Acidobacteriota bacterium]
MFDCSSEITDFHNAKVRLPKATQDLLRGQRDANRARVRAGLKAAEKPKPERFVPQGSHAMYTINQQPENDYDIDEGVVFLKADLKGLQGGDLCPLEARKRVCDAVTDPAFSQQPEVRKNCVRIYYSAGHHVDMPVYRQFEDGSGKTSTELASSEWKISDPEAVTRWFNQAVKAKSPDETNGRQMRRVVRQLKYLCKSRSSWNMPSGFVLSVLVNETYVARAGRDDQAFRDTIRTIHSRLHLSLVVRHPVVAEDLTKTSADASMIELRGRLGEMLEHLEVLDDPECTKKAALRAWAKVFRTDYFDQALEALAASLTVFTRTGSAPEEPVEKRGGGRFG